MGRKSKVQDPLAQIFDFIFEQQELPPDKRKPVKPTGISGNTELTNAIAAVLENPAAFELDQIVENYSEALNFKLAELRFSEDNIKKAEVGVASLVDIVKDPVGYAQKVRNTTKGIRKSMRAKYLGAAATELVLNAYLQKKGFSKELQDIIKHSPAIDSSLKSMYEFSNFKEADAYSVSVAKNPMLSGANREYLNRRSAELKAKLSMNRTQWESLTQQQQSKIVKAILTESDSSGANIKDAFVSQFGTGVGNTMFTTFLTSKGQLKYEQLEIENLDNDMRTISSARMRGGVWQDDLARISYDRLDVAKKFLESSESFSFIAGSKTNDLLRNYKTYSENIGTQIDQIKRDLRLARSRGDRSEEIILREQLELRKATQRQMGFIAISGNIGMIEGYLNSIRDYWNVGSVIKGDFFKSAKNQFYCPTSKVGFSWNGEKITEFMIPADQKALGSRTYKILDSYNEFFARLYYLTPGAIFRNYFVTGEGFAFQAYNQQRLITKFLSSSPVAGFDFARFTKDPAYRTSIFSGGTITNPQLLKMLHRYDRLGNMTYMFSAISRLQARLQDYINDHITVKFRSKVYEAILRSKVFSGLIDGSEAIGLLNTWVKNGSLLNLVKGLIHGIAEFLGVTISPVVNFIIRIASSLVVEKLYDLAVPLFGVVVYALIGIVGLVFFFSFWLVRGNAVKYSISASSPPGGIGYCEVEGDEWGAENTEFYGSPIDIPAPIDSSCPLGSVKYSCSQGFTDTTCSHKNITSQFPVDLTGIVFIYAPKYCDSSTCTAASIVDPGRCSDEAYTGQVVNFNDGQGNMFSYRHVQYIPPSNGSTYKGGEPVARVYQSAGELIRDDPQQKTVINPDPDIKIFQCWTGAHLHLIMTHNGSYMDPIDFLAKMGCVGVQSESACPPCR